jgi:hypothetical protein
MFKTLEHGMVAWRGMTTDCHAEQTFSALAVHGNAQNFARSNQVTASKFRRNSVKAAGLTFHSWSQTVVQYF